MASMFVPRPAEPVTSTFWFCVKPVNSQYRDLMPSVLCLNKTYFPIGVPLWSHNEITSGSLSTSANSLACKLKFYKQIYLRINFNFLIFVWNIFNYQATVGESWHYFSFYECHSNGTHEDYPPAKRPVFNPSPFYPLPSNASLFDYQPYHCPTQEAGFERRDGEKRRI